MQAEEVIVTTRSLAYLIHKIFPPAVKADQPELSIDNPDMTLQEKLAHVRVSELVGEYLGAQELQMLGEHGMSEAVQMFVDKDDSTSIKTSVLSSIG